MGAPSAIIIAFKIPAHLACYTRVPFGESWLWLTDDLSSSFYSSLFFSFLLFSGNTCTPKSPRLMLELSFCVVLHRLCLFENSCAKWDMIRLPSNAFSQASSPM